MPPLDGARILVVGATGGLGSALARLLHHRGARLALAGRSPDRLTALDLSGAEPVLGDLRDPDTPAALVRTAVDRLGGLDGVVYAAGLVAFGGVTELDDDDVEELLLLNLLAPVRLIRAAFPSLGRGGFVVSISAVTAEQPVARMAAYSASKAAISAYAVAARLEGRRAGIRVLDVRPPHTETGLADRPIAGQKPRLPVGLRPQDVAERIVRGIVDGETELPASAFGAGAGAGRSRPG